VVPLVWRANFLLRIRFLVVFPRAQDLLLRAKHLFVAAMVFAIAPAGGSRISFFSPEF
jgi:hypothetical protein